MMDKDKPHDFIQAFANGLQVIRAFDNEHIRMTLSEVAERCKMTRAMARRLLWTLEKSGYAGISGRQFYLSPKVLELGYAYLASQPLLAIAQPLMEALVQQVHESCSMSVLDGQNIVYVIRIPTKRIMKISLGVGSRLPAYATSMGRVLLGALSDAELDVYLAQADLQALTEYTLTDRSAVRAKIEQARQQGWAMLNQELELGLCSVAVPIVAPGGKTIAAINVGVPSTIVGTDVLKADILPVLQTTAAEIQRTLALQPGHY